MKTIADYPELVAQWHSTKNGELKPENISFGSHKKVWWKCPVAVDHEWQANPNNRMKSGCPCCSGQKVSQSNCLAIIYPELAQQWHPTKNGDLTPFDVLSRSGKKIWWKCSVADDHEWQASPAARSSGNGCACCRGYKVVLSNCLAVSHPELVKEWSVKNGDLTPYMVAVCSRRIVWWICGKGHGWQAKIAERTNNRTNCPICNESKGEKAIAEVLTKNNFKFVRQAKYRTCKNKFMLPFDFVVETEVGSKAVEYQGQQHYEAMRFGGKNNIDKFEKTIKNDTIKAAWCKEQNMPLLIIPYWEFRNVEKIVKDFIWDAVKPLQSEGLFAL